MTAINFPDSPSNGDTHVVGGVTYTYNSTETKWKTTINSNAFLPLSGGTVSGNIVLGGEIQHDGDTDTKLHFDTDIIKLDTAGSERFRVGSAGQLGIGGATYGTSGQVLTSQGSGSAPQWATPTSGEFTRLAATTISTNTTNVSFNLPSGINWIQVMMFNVVKTANAYSRIQLGTSQSWETSGYNSAAGFVNTVSTDDSDDSTTGFMTRYGGTDSDNTVYTLVRIDGNSWVGSGTLMGGNGDSTHFAAGRKTMPSEVRALRVQLNTGDMSSGIINMHYQ